MKKIYLTSIWLFTLISISVNTVGAQGEELGPEPPIFKIPNPIEEFTNLGQIITALLTLVYFVAGLAMFANLVIGGLQWISAGGDPKALDSARRRITNAVIGLIIVVAAFAIALILEQVFNIQIISGFTF